MDAHERFPDQPIRQVLHGCVDDVGPIGRVQRDVVATGFAMQNLDEYAVSDNANRVVYSGTTLRAFDTKSGTWTMRYVDQRGGQTGRWSELVRTKERLEIHVEQRGQTPDGRATVLKIRYYNIQANHFSWAADASSDGGVTWVREYLRIEATRRVAAPVTQ